MSLYSAPSLETPGAHCNAHVVLYWYLKAAQAHHNKQFLRFEFFRQWHIDELESAHMPTPQPDEQQQLVDRIMSLAVIICTRSLGIVDVQFSGAANLLHVQAKSLTNKGLDQHVELADPADSDFTKRRAASQLRDIIRALEAYTLRPVPGAPRAA